MVHDYSKLHGLIIEKYRTLKAFAEVIGKAPGTISDKLNGVKPITNKDIEIWIEPLGIPLSDIGLYFFTQKV